MSGLLLAHDGNNCFCDVEHAEEVGVDLHAEIFDINVVDRSSNGVSGIVDDNIDTAELVMASLHCCNGLVVASDIEGNGKDSVSAVFLDEAGDLLWLAGGSDDRVAVVKSGFGDGGAKATRGASDEPDLHDGRNLNRKELKKLEEVVEDVVRIVKDE
jgi:hypothetical protein